MPCNHLSLGLLQCARADASTRGTDAGGKLTRWSQQLLAVSQLVDNSNLRTLHINLSPMVFGPLLALLCYFLAQFIMSISSIRPAYEECKNIV